MGSSHTMAVVGAPRFIDIVVVVVAVVEESSREVVLKKRVLHNSFSSSPFALLHCKKARFHELIILDLK